MPLNLFVADQIIFWMASIHKHAACVYRGVGSIYLHSSFTLSWRDRLLSRPGPLLWLDKRAEKWTWKCWARFTKQALLCFIDFWAPAEPNPGLRGRNFILTSLFLGEGLTFCPRPSKCFPKKLLLSWPTQRPLPLACHRDKSDAALWVTEREALYWDSSRCSRDSCRVVASPTL